ncbi:putative membrane protein [Candidatus Nitrosopumilus salaria BD31]|uniref:Membrane protein n=1 Tax=Candidatus Nitrosopumilus salarius BD31 TaxID=859350 RepID=I3D3R4_9ARCH|nr:CbtA family protein [Candidatus Nitrosopumilus salaria]EIJ66357.1 putative membrane protein [Candidatus Nitrosopumilus salaria BD31]
MKASLFIIIVLVSGTSAGLVHGIVNYAIVEPYLDQAIGIENQHLFASGDEENTPDFWVKYDGYRVWQKSGQILAGVILGTSIGSLFGIVFALSKNSLPGINNVKKALILSGIMWTTLYLIPFLKYPANPPTVGDSETLVLRVFLYLSLIAISGIGAIGFYKLSKKFKNKKKFIALIGYGVCISIAFIAMPDNPDEITVSMTLVNEFRLMSVLGVSSFWISVSLILGYLWDRLEFSKKTTQYT